MSLVVLVGLKFRVFHGAWSWNTIYAARKCGVKRLDPHDVVGIDMSHLSGQFCVSTWPHDLIIVTATWRVVGKWTRSRCVNICLGKSSNGWGEDWDRREMKIRGGGRQRLIDRFMHSTPPKPLGCGFAYIITTICLCLVIGFAL